MNEHRNRLPLGTSGHFQSKCSVILSVSDHARHGWTIGTLCRPGEFLGRKTDNQHQIYRQNSTLSPNPGHDWAMICKTCVTKSPQKGGMRRMSHDDLAREPQHTNIFKVTMCLASTHSFVLCETTPGGYEIRCLAARRGMSTEIDSH